MYYTKQEEQKARIKSAMIVIGILAVAMFAMAFFVSFYDNEPSNVKETYKFNNLETSASTDLNDTKKCTETIEGTKKITRCDY